MTVHRIKSGTSGLGHLLVGAAMFVALLCIAFADDAAPSTPPAKPAQAFNVKNAFSNICNFCHRSYGRHADKGPQLMNSERSDEFLFNRIKNGSPGKMAAFGTAFTDDQIRLMVKFIRSLKPDQEPENP